MKVNGLHDLQDKGKRKRKRKRSESGLPDLILLPRVDKKRKTLKKNNKNKPKQKGKNVHLITSYCVTEVSKHSQLHASITKYP